MNNNSEDGSLFTLYGYKCFLLLLIVVMVLLCLIYKLNFIILVYWGGKTCDIISTTHGFQHPLEALECISYG